LAQLAASAVEHAAIRADAVVALADASPGLAATLLQRQLEDVSPLVRQSVAIALGRRGTPDAAELLGELVEGERDPAVRERATAAAGTLGIAVRGARRARGSRQATPAVDRARGAGPSAR
jgi:HEAT repeat protein